MSGLQHHVPGGASMVPGVRLALREHRGGAADGCLGVPARLFLTYPGGAGPSSLVPHGADGICPPQPVPLRPRGPCLLAQHQPTPPVAFLMSQNRLGRKFGALVQPGAR